MMKLSGVVLLMSLAATAWASPEVRIVFNDGRVTLVTLTARGATPAQILAEWARVGGTRIVNGDRIPGPPLKLDLQDVPEMDALEIVLRAAAGFIATARTSSEPSSSASSSGMAQVTVLETVSRPSPPQAVPPSAVPVEAPAPPPPPTLPPIFDANGARRVIGPDGQPVPDDQDGAPPAPPPQ